MPGNLTAGMVSSRLYGELLMIEVSQSGTESEEFDQFKRIGCGTNSHAFKCNEWNGNLKS